MNLLELLRGEKHPTETQLRDALAQAEAEHAEALAELEELQERRLELLFDDDAIDKIEDQIKQKQRQVDRLEVLTIKAQERLRKVAEDERRAELDRIYAKAEAKIAAGVRIYQKEWPPLAHKLRHLAEELDRLQSEIDEVNNTLLKAGDPRQVPEIDRIARPRVEGEPDYRGPSLARGLRLPSTTHLTHYYHPTITEVGMPYPPAQRPDR